MTGTSSVIVTQIKWSSSPYAIGLRSKFQFSQPHQAKLDRTADHTSLSFSGRRAPPFAARARAVNLGC